MNHSRVFIIAGISGAGKSTVLRVLSDCGFYTIDNLPPALFREFFSLAEKSAPQYGKAALLLNMISAEPVDKFLAALKLSAGSPIELLFLDASTQTILRRYSETRRPHPSFEPERHSTLSDAIQDERNYFEPFKAQANFIIDTSEMSVHELRRQLLKFVDSNPQAAPKLRVNFVSFGYKYGIPMDCDLVVDVRFLPNPYFVEELRSKSGLDAAVAKYVISQPQTREFSGKYLDLLTSLLPHYQYEGKAYLNVGIGCTGGRHRSVAIAEELAPRLDHSKYLVSINHRDIER